MHYLNKFESGYAIYCRCDRTISRHRLPSGIDRAGAAAHEQRLINYCAELALDIEEYPTLRVPRRTNGYFLFAVR